MWRVKGSIAPTRAFPGRRSWVSERVVYRRWILVVCLCIPTDRLFFAGGFRGSWAESSISQERRPFQPACISVCRPLPWWCRKRAQAIGFFGLRGLSLACLGTGASAKRRSTQPPPSRVVPREVRYFTCQAPPLEGFLVTCNVYNRLVVLLLLVCCP